MDFQNRVALVTGGTGALGSSVVLDLLESGARVAVPYIVDHEWQGLLAAAGAGRERLEGRRVDLTRPAEVDSWVQSILGSYRRVDFLLAIAGGFGAGKVQETSEEVWDLMLKVNLRSLTCVLRPVIPTIMQQNFGRIITVSSGAIVDQPGAGIAAYAVSKAAVRQLSEIVSEEVKARDIRVHCLMPGTIDTQANRRAMPDADRSQWVSTGEVAQVIHRLLLNGARSPVVVAVQRGSEAPAL